MPKAIGFVPTEDGVYKEFLGLLKSHDEKQREVFTELMKDYIKVHKNGNPTYTLKPFIEDSEFIAFPAMGSSTEKLVKFAQKTTDSTLEDMEIQGLKIMIIAKWFRRYDKEQREKHSFTNIRDACKALGVYL